MQTISCPGCGAPVQFRSTASVMAVCEFCKTTLLKEADAVKNLGKMSELLEDYSPIQLGTSGSFGGNGFTVIGRIQLRYADGMWNEWFVMFADGKAAWLGDASGQYMLTSQVPGGSHFPTFEMLVPGRSYTVGGQPYTAADVRTAQCIAGQGELPFKVGQGWQSRTVDLRHGRSFLTLDYSDSDQPIFYTGQAVTLEQLQCQLLRDQDQVQSASAQYRGKIVALSCPSCGSNASFVPGLTNTVICPGCHAQLDVSGDTAQVLALARSVAQVSTTLELGAEATINGKPYELIGIMRCSDEQNTIWTEYLLVHPRAGFLWLIETAESWARASVMDEWPVWVTEDQAVLGSMNYRKLYRYRARVIFVVGAFNWRVGVGNQTEVVEFQNGPVKLAAEMTSTELTWSQSSPVSADQIRAWFGKTVAADKLVESLPLKSTAVKFVWLLLLLNLIPLLMAPTAWLPVMIGLAAVYYPATLLDGFNHVGSGDE